MEQATLAVAVFKLVSQASAGISHGKSIERNFKSFSLSKEILKLPP
jgi:hypothetical protein